MSLPGIEVQCHIEKVLPKILVITEIEEEEPLKNTMQSCKVAFVKRKFSVMSPVSVRFLYATSKPTNNDAHIQI